MASGTSTPWKLMLPSSTPRKAGQFAGSNACAAEAVRVERARMRRHGPIIGGAPYPRLCCVSNCSNSKQLRVSSGMTELMAVFDIPDSAITQARARIAAHVVRTPLVRGWLGCLFKLETQQPTGSFKVRPAFNSVLASLDECRARGVVTSSSGNFAQAVA